MNPIDQNELEVARQRIHAYSACGHPVISSAVWLLAEVERLLAELAAENACDERMRLAAERTGVYAHNGKSWPECAADEIMRLQRKDPKP